MYDIVFTGQGPKSRDEYKRLAERAGHVVRSHFCSKTNLVVGSYEAFKEGTTKARKALQNDVTRVSYAEFVDLMEEHGVFTPDFLDAADQDAYHSL